MRMCKSSAASSKQLWLYVWTQTTCMTHSHQQSEEDEGKETTSVLIGLGIWMVPY